LHFIARLTYLVERYCMFSVPPCTDIIWENGVLLDYTTDCNNALVSVSAVSLRGNGSL